jgi:hypothetical protein
MPTITAIIIILHWSHINNANNYRPNQVLVHRRMVRQRHHDRRPRVVQQQKLLAIALVSHCVGVNINPSMHHCIYLSRGTICHFNSRQICSVICDISIR